MKKVLITGGSGYLASKLIPKLHESEYTIDILDLKPCDMPMISGQYTCDITKMPILMKSYDLIIHALATFNPDMAMKINYAGTNKLLRSTESGRLIFISTCGTSNPGDTSKYTVSKAIAEMSILEKHHNSIVVSLASVYGIAPVMNFAGLVNNLVQNALQGTVEIRGSNEYRPIVHINDAVSNIMKAINSTEKTMLIATENVTKQQIADTIVKYMPFEIKVISEKSRSPGYKSPLLQPTVNLEQGIKEMIGAMI